MINLFIIYLKFVRNVEKIVIEAVPAVHGFTSRKGKLVGNSNGYWIDLIQSGNKYSIYTSDDTLPNLKPGILLDLVNDRIKEYNALESQEECKERKT